MISQNRYYKTHKGSVTTCMYDTHVLVIILLYYYVLVSHQNEMKCHCSLKLECIRTKYICTYYGLVVKSVYSSMYAIWRCDERVYNK